MVKEGGKGGVWDSWGSLLMTINRLTVMTICDKSLGEESPQRLPAPNQTGYLKKKKKYRPRQSDSLNDHSGGGGREGRSIVPF